jgi:hypothetical protein
MGLEIPQGFHSLQDLGQPDHRIRRAVLTLFVENNSGPIPIGTAFAVTSTGLLMTAAHNIAHIRKNLGRPKQAYVLYMTDQVLVNDEDVVVAVSARKWPITTVWTENIDIGFCWLKAPSTLDIDPLSELSPFVLSPAMPPVGSSILAFGHYNMQRVSNNTIESLSFAQDDAFTTGTVTDLFPEGRDRGMLSFPCFQTDARFEHGMSGGPVINEAGAVCGVICSSLPPDEEYPGHISYVSAIWPAMRMLLPPRGATTASLATPLVIDSVGMDVKLGEDRIRVDGSIAQVTVERLGIHDATVAYHHIEVDIQPSE